MSRRGHRASRDQRYLYRVWDQWDQNGPRLVLLLLSPWRMEPAPGQDQGGRRRAVDELQASWGQLARQMGYSGWEVVFLFPRRVAWAQVLLDLPGVELVGGETGENALRGALAVAVEPYARIVAAWGAWGRLDGRGEAVARYVTEELGRDLWALGTDASGAPLQPLQAKDCRGLVLYRRAAKARTT